MNANRVRAAWGGLPGNAYKALTEMAWSARDGDSPPQYWGGPGPIARALGRVDVDDAPLSRTDERIVVNAVAALVDAGAIRCVQKPAPGVRARYALYLAPGSAPALEPDAPADPSAGTTAGSTAGSTGRGKGRGRTAPAPPAPPVPAPAVAGTDLPATGTDPPSASATGPILQVVDGGAGGPPALPRRSRRARPAPP